MSELTRAALERAKRTLIEYVCASIPPGVVITPAMVQNFNIDVVKWVIIAWVCTGAIQAIGAYFWALKSGLPEAQPAIEATVDDVSDEPAKKYDDEDTYDDLKVDEAENETDEDEETSEEDYDDELEQEN